MEENKEITQEEIDKVTESLEGKTAEELNQMATQAEEDLSVTIHNNASEYVFNVMDLGPSYTKEAWDKIQKEIQDQNSTEEGMKAFAERYSGFTDEDIKLNVEVLNQGYRSFGREFINAMIDKDPDSAKGLFELTTQMYLTLNDEINTITRQTEEMLKERKEEKKESN